MEAWLLGIFAALILGLGAFILRELWESRILLTKIESRLLAVEREVVSFHKEIEENRRTSEDNRANILQLTGSGK